MYEENYMTRLDHIVIASNDLESLAEQFHQLTGVEPVEGGRHEGKGTANKLVGLGPGRYIELIGPDPSQKNFQGTRPLKVDQVDKMTVVGWSVRTDDITVRVNHAMKYGYDPGNPEEMSRETPDGGTLSWVLTPLSGGLDGTIPFLIDWKKSKHPSIDIPEVKLLSLSITHPQPDVVRLALQAIRAEELVLDINQGEVSIEIELDTPKGKVKIK